MHRRENEDEMRVFRGELGVVDVVLME